MAERSLAEQVAGHYQHLRDRGIPDELLPILVRDFQVARMYAMWGYQPAPIISVDSATDTTELAEQVVQAIEQRLIKVVP